jgi:iron complex outermembrane receptor protein
MRTERRDGWGRALLVAGFGCCLAAAVDARSAPDDSASPAAAVEAPPADDPAAYKRLTLEELMQLEVTSVSRRPEKLSEVASAIQVVTGDEIRRSGASTLPQALRLADNLIVAQKNSHDWAISARGFNTALANKMLVLIDGRTVYTPLFSGVFWDTQDRLLEDLDRIEVISGPGGTLWGANAVNGVINIVSKSAKETQGLYVEAGGGTQPQGFAAVRHGAALSEKTHYRVNARYQERAPELLPSGDDATDAWERGAGGFRVDGEASERDQWTVQGDAYLGDEELVSGGEARIKGANVLGRWSRRLSVGSDWKLRAYYDRTYLRLPVPALIINSLPFAPAGVLVDELETCDVDFLHSFLAGDRHRITWGAGYRYWRDEVENAPALAFLPATRAQSLANVFVQDEVRLAPELALTLGTKIEHNDYTGVEYDPSLRLQWNFAADRTLWGAISRAVRTPSRIDRDLSQPAPPFLVILAGNTSYDSEKVIAYELGYRGIGGRATGSISAFYNDYSDVRSTRTTPVTILPFFFANDLEGETYGVELSGKVQLEERWRLQGGYTYLQERLRVRRGQVDFNAARNETADPEHQLSVRSSVDLRDDVELDAALRWVDSLAINNGPTVRTVPSYFELDLRLGWRATPSLTLALVGQNLLHDQHPEYGFPSPVRVEIGRAVYGKLSWRR